MCRNVLCVLDKTRVDYPSAGPLRRGAQLGAIGLIGLKPALVQEADVVFATGKRCALCLCTINKAFSVLDDDSLWDLKLFIFFVLYKNFFERQNRS